MTPARDIPSIEQLRQRASARTLEARHGRAALVEALRAEADVMRARLADGPGPPDVGAAIEAAARVRLDAQAAGSLRQVINATGVILHTNLGRAPLCDAAAARIMELATAYTNLEYDIPLGSRGHRDVHLKGVLCRLTGADDALVVNNTAAAALIVLAALAGGKEVLISRGELVEIGGGFRVPEVMAQSGARLREVGTTNRTRLADYAAAITDRTGLILRVHRSNFRIEGFTERPALETLVGLGRRFNVPVVEDLGSGYLRAGRESDALRDEPDVHASVAAGADIVMFSGDKLLGGPQSGIVVGRMETLAAVRAHPLMRALRVDKLTYAALEATLGEIVAGRAPETVPVMMMIRLTPEAIARRAESVVSRLRSAGVATDLLDGHSTIGGGSVPGSTLPTRLIAISQRTPDILEAALRRGVPPVIARIEDGRVVLDLRTIPPAQDGLLADVVIAAVSGLG
jgi:L-seryl-tRNA(Ser) seleniumtransferase